MAGEKESWRESRRQQDFSEELARKGWFHSFRLPNGVEYDGYLSVAELERRVSLLPIPADLTGKRVLDIGAWDGWYSFEMERRGAQVTAIDCVKVKNFLKIHAALDSRVDYRQEDIQDLTPARVGQFDVVLFLAVLYHLKHPLLALERVCALSTELMIISSFTSSDYRRPLAEIMEDVPTLDFFETDELGGQLDNWFGPNLPCLMAMCRAAGFARLELVETTGAAATLACYRKWLPAAADAPASVKLLNAINARTSGINFQAAASEEHIACWFESDAESITRADVMPEGGGYGVPALHVSKRGERMWQVNFRLPPGLAPGWHPVTIRVGDSAPSNVLQIAVDVPFVVHDIAIHAACDAHTWKPGVMERSVSVFVRGLPANADRNNVEVMLDGIALAVDAVKTFDAETTQINARLEEDVPRGTHHLTVIAGGRTSSPCPVDVI